MYRCANCGKDYDSLSVSGLQLDADTGMFTCEICEEPLAVVLASGHEVMNDDDRRRRRAYLKSVLDKAEVGVL